MDEKKSPPPDDEKSAEASSTTKPDDVMDTDAASVVGPPPYTPLDPFKDPPAPESAPAKPDSQATDIYGDAMAVDQGEESSDDDLWELTPEDLEALEEMENKPLEPTPAPTPTPSSQSQSSNINRMSSSSSSARQSNSTTNNRRSSPSPDMCINCGVRPKFKQGFQVFPACGEECGRALAAMHGFTDHHNDVRRGQMHNPNHTSSSNSSSRQSGPGFIASFFNPAPPPLKMCKVCGVRPRCQRGTRIFPTCGLTCAAKLNPPRSSDSTEMCEYCKQRPKVVMNGRRFPHCGRTCRDKAKAADDASTTASSSGSCTTCLNCWKQFADPPKEDFCSTRCKGIIERRAPMLLEVPRGHVSFNAVERAFKLSWGQQKSQCPSVKKIYMVIMNPSQISRFEEYGSNAMLRGNLKKKVKDARWIGNHRECGIGDSGNMTPCGSPRCTMCVVLRASHAKQNLGDGISTTSLPKAAQIASTTKKRTSHVVMMTHVYPGKAVELEVGEPLPQGYDSVRLVGYTPFGKKIDMDEHIVYDCDALRPLYFISYE
ncbi:hypothetical protein CPB83DRAFT_858606 [Crepidotus variabilis]|uniref:C2H2-type domain-containing protein n=1 Tax=Crepidotus variabilis TaxID=179855 RepID=A0A9P6EBN4_9AGAR|nr:hypothetical protein CPB83DRAFT_858606 [Crepidotus variabilis]